MMKVNVNKNLELKKLSNFVKENVFEKNFAICLEIILEAMKLYPNDPQPHNLYGIVLEKSGQHCLAMRHFRAAYALDPSYLPTQYNLQVYGTFDSLGQCYFDEDDLPKIKERD